MFVLLYALITTGGKFQQYAQYLYHIGFCHIFYQDLAGENVAQPPPGGGGGAGIKSPLCMPLYVFPGGVNKPWPYCIIFGAPSLPARPTLTSIRFPLCQAQSIINKQLLEQKHPPPYRYTCSIIINSIHVSF